MTIAEKWLQVHVVVLVILSTLLLGNGLNSLSVPLLAGSAAVIAFIFTERLRWIVLNRFVANVLAIAVAGFAIYRFFTNESGDIKLAAIANLLTYVQVILLFQRKSPRLYWNIWVLSLLQVVVAGALSLHFQVGILFFAFFLVSLSAMTVMAVYVDSDPPGQRMGNLNTAPTKAAESQARKRTLRRMFEQLAELEPMGVQVYPTPPGRLGRFMKMSWLAGTITIIFAGLLFYSIPRQEDAWYGPNYSKRAKVGFSPSVSFDLTEDIRPSNQTVMRVQFFDDKNKAQELAIEPYFRGITVPIFSTNGGETKWLPDPSASPRIFAAPPDVQPNIAAAPRNTEDANLGTDEEDVDLTEGFSLVRQQAVLQPSDDFILFSMLPAFKNAATSDQVRFDRRQESLIWAGRQDEYMDGPFHYEVAVPLYFDRPFPAIPAQQKVWEGMSETIKPSPRDFPSLYEAAATVVTRIETKTTNRRLLAFRMSEYLGNNEDFTYTLNYGSVKFDRTLNPIEDFVRNHKTGHCEYYAAALALMLRTVDIPSRLVIGYKGGDYNPIGKYYEVKEKHAHVWVEAYLPVADCSPRMVATGQASPICGAWYRLDPTPDADTETGEIERKGLVERAADAISYAHYVWDDYVVGMNSERQQRNLFGSFYTSEDWQSRAAEFHSAIRRNFWTMVVRVLLLTVFVAGAWQLYRLARARFGYKGRPRRILRSSRVANVVDAVSPWLANLMFGVANDRRGARVEFYERFLKILGRQGISPAGHQTALEFAATALYRIGTVRTEDKESGSHGEAHSRLQTILGFITSEFYRVRFGEDSLDSSRSEKVENALKELESMLAGHAVRPK